MGVLRALGFGKDPHVEWMVEAFGAKPGKVVVNRLYESSPRYQMWQGETRGIPLSFYTEGGHKCRGGGAVYLGTAGPRFMEDVSDYRCFFYVPRAAPSLSIDDPRWTAAAAKAMGDSDWSSSFPDEAFERGVAVGRFALERQPARRPAGIRTPRDVARAAGWDVRWSHEGLSLSRRSCGRARRRAIDAREASLRRATRLGDPSTVGIDRLKARAGIANVLAPAVDGGARLTLHP